MLQSIDLCEALRRSCGRLLLVSLALLVFAMPAVAASEDDSAADETDSAEAMATEEETKPPVDLTAIAALEFRSYDTGWVRYRNGMYWDHPILHVEGLTQFPFRTVSLPGRVNIALLRDFDFVRALIEEYDLHIDEAALQGLCDTERMRRYGSSDVICMPGTSVMEPGMVITVIYHPETFVIAALTTTIENIGGIATRADEWRNLLAVAPAEETAPTQGQADGCGPLAPGQWISAAEYQRQGLNLPISTAGSAAQVTDYVCIVEADGKAYLQAHPVAKPQQQTTSQPASSGGGDDGGGSGGSGGGGSDSGGGDDGAGQCPPGQAPIYDYSDYDNPAFVACGSA